MWLLRTREEEHRIHKCFSRGPTLSRQFSRTAPGTWWLEEVSGLLSREAACLLRTVHDEASMVRLLSGRTKKLDSNRFTGRLGMCSRHTDEQKAIVPKVVRCNTCGEDVSATLFDTSWLQGLVQNDRLSEAKCLRCQKGADPDSADLMFTCTLCQKDKKMKMFGPVMQRQILLKKGNTLRCDECQRPPCSQCKLRPEVLGVIEEWSPRFQSSASVPDVPQSLAT